MRIEPMVNRTQLKIPMMLLLLLGKYADKSKKFQ